MGKKIGSALISVFEKKGLERILALLAQRRVRILSTGGTWEYIHKLQYPAERVEDLTGYPAILGGRVKTLHPAIFGGILGQQDNPRDQAEMAQYGIDAIDLVIVDLYPFEAWRRLDVPEKELIEKIDIGGVSLIRSAAKNFKETLVVSHRAQYGALANILVSPEGESTLEQRRQFAAQAFVRTAEYEATIAKYFAESATSQSAPTSSTTSWPTILLSPSTATASLRYGENPHQKAIFYGNIHDAFEQLHGKALSYNNILDLDAGLPLLDEFEEPTFAIIKHGTPCGLGTSFSLAQAWDKALSSDTQSAFGGILLANRPIDAETSKKMDAIFFEVCIAPAFTPDALDVLCARKNRILLARRLSTPRPHAIRSALNGVLVQTRDEKRHELPWEHCVTRATPTDAQAADLLFANRAVKHCKSNAIVLARDGQLLGVGAGETSRVDAMRHALEKAKAYGHDPKGAVLASDAFFPFTDTIDLAAEAGIQAIVQPGGSIRDKECIEACDRHGLSMVFTGFRHFRH